MDGQDEQDVDQSGTPCSPIVTRLASCERFDPGSSDHLKGHNYSSFRRRLVLHAHILSILYIHVPLTDGIAPRAGGKKTRRREVHPQSPQIPRCRSG